MESLLVPLINKPHHSHSIGGHPICIEEMNTVPLTTWCELALEGCQQDWRMLSAQVCCEAAGEARLGAFLWGFLTQQGMLKGLEEN